MKPMSDAPTLSEHLLNEARRFLFYPERITRNGRKARIQSKIDRHVNKLVDWRKTFSPRPIEHDDLEFWSDSVLLDEVYCRELLVGVNGFVNRTRQLRNMVLVSTDDEAFVYLRQAATCYIFGLADAAIALSRAALESALKSRTAPIFGLKAVRRAELHELIEYATRGRVLPRDVRPLVESIQREGNDVLHAKSADLDTARTVLDACRSVLSRLSTVRPIPAARR